MPPSTAAATATHTPHSEPIGFDVLVLDDNSFDQARIRRACKETGLPVSTVLVSTLDDFSSALDAQIFDVVLIDYQLPQGDGLEAQKLVQRHPRNFGAAVVMISSDMRTDIAVASLKKGSLDCLDKDALTSEKLRELMLASAKLFAEASRHWIGEMFTQQRVEIAQDVSRLLRDELSGDRLSDTVDQRVLSVLQDNGLFDTNPVDIGHVLDPDEPFRFR